MRFDIIKKLIESFNLILDGPIKEITIELPHPSKLASSDGFFHYVYYFWSYKQGVTMGHLAVDWASGFGNFCLYKSDGQQMFGIQHCKVERTTTNIFLYMSGEKGHIFTVSTFYIGNHQLPKDAHQLPYLAGTYTGARIQDNAAVGGIVVLEKHDNVQEVLQIINKESPTSPIVSMIFQKRLWIKPDFVFALEDLKLLNKNKNSLTSCAGNYMVFSRSDHENEIQVSALRITASGLVKYRGYRNEMYEGLATMVDNNLYLNIKNQGKTKLFIRFVVGTNFHSLTINSALHGTSCSINRENIPRASREILIRAKERFEEIECLITKVGEAQFKKIDSNYQGIATFLTRDETSIINAEPFLENEFEKKEGDAG
ncbi:MAG: hypothetical protein AAF502_13040 [Bacteroidota bacterium]